MAQNYVTTSRHGTMFYFRRCVPDDLRAVIGKRYLVTSLGCGPLREAVIQARELAAWTDNAFRVLRAMAADDLAPDQSALMALINLKRRELLLQDQLEAEQAERREQGLLTANKLLRQQLEIEVLRRGLAVSSASPSPQLDRLPENSPPPASGLSLRAVWEKYKAEKIALGQQGSKKGWKDGEDTAKYDHLPHVRAFWLTLPKGEETPIAEVTFEAALAYQSVVLGKPEESPANKDKRLMRAGALFKWAKSKRYVSDDFAGAFKYPGDVPKNNYLKFSADDLRALFQTPAYQNCAFGAPFHYWLPVLGLFTGGRINELCQLRAPDFFEREGVQVIALLDEDGKRTKTKASRRLIPVHSTLVRLGLLEFVQAVRKQRSDGRLFPELSEARARPGDFSKEAIRYFTEYRRACGVGALEGRSRKAFHSFRSTLIDALRRADVPKDRRTRLAGHEYADTQDTSYDGGDVLEMFSVESLKNDLEKVAYDVELVRFQPDKIVPKRAKGLRASD